jgi:hypothetical protein
MNRYEFRNASGRVCCSSDDVNNLCPACKAKAGSATSAPPDGYLLALQKRNPSLTTAAASVEFDPSDPMWSYKPGLARLAEQRESSRD